MCGIHRGIRKGGITRKHVQARNSGQLKGRDLYRMISNNCFILNTFESSQKVLHASLLQLVLANINMFHACLRQVARTHTDTLTLTLTLTNTHTHTPEGTRQDLDLFYSMPTSGCSRHSTHGSSLHVQRCMCRDLPLLR